MCPHGRIGWQAKGAFALVTFVLQSSNLLLKLAELRGLPIQFQLAPIQTPIHLL
jgi:hypothetical protein